MKAFSQRTITDLIGGYAQMVDDRCVLGWKPFLLTFRFRDIAGSATEQKAVMLEDVDKLYRRLLCETTRRPHAKPADYLPLLIAMFDYPIFKRRAQPLRDYIVNDGLHMHGILMLPPWSRMKVGLAEHFFEHQDVYCSNFLMPPQVEPINRSADHATDYAIKGIKSARNDELDLHIWPYSRSELPTRAEAREDAAKYRRERDRSTDSDAIL